MIRFSFNVFPSSARLKEDCGLPWGCVITPFLQPNFISSPVTPLIATDQPERCENCYGYINLHASIERNGGWRCPLCQTRNATPERLYGKNLNEFPEFTSPIYECDVIGKGDETIGAGEGVTSPPIYLAVVDITANRETMDIFKRTLLGAIEALSPEAEFGLITFGSHISIYNLRSGVAHVQSLPIPESGELPIPITDVVPLSGLAVKIGAHKAHITAAIDSLSPLAGVLADAPQSAVLGGDGSRGTKRGFGSAMKAVIDAYTDKEAPQLNVRLLAFLAGLPNYGLGALAPRFSALEEETAHARAELLSPQTPFYRTLAQTAAEDGVGVTLCVLSHEYVDLASIKFLSLFTGGDLLYYPQASTSAMPQDVYRLLQRPHAFRMLLRVRVPTGVKVNHAYGRFVEDGEYENVYHAACCNQNSTFGFDFEFTGGDMTGPGCVQLALAYSFFPPGAKKMVRRLRVVTQELPATRELSEIFRTMDSEVVLSLLAHKITRATLDDGVEEARQLVRDWFTIVVVQYARLVGVTPGAEDRGWGLLDMAANPLAPLVFGLLKHALLITSTDPDRRIFVQSLFGGLNPSNIRAAVYPVVNLYKSVDDGGEGPLRLTRSSVVTTGAPIYVADSYSDIVVYYANQSQPYPPPPESNLRQLLNYMKEERDYMPRVVVARAGTLESQQFDQLLIEEPNLAGISYAEFVEQINNEAAKYMKA